MKNEPVVFWGSVGVLSGMVLRHFIPNVSDEFIQVLIDVVSVGGPALIGLIYARSQVTPTADPHNDEGVPLVPDQY